MASRWTTEEEKRFHSQLYRLYVVENKSIRETALILHIAESSVFDRMQRLHIPSTPQRKTHYLNKRNDVTLPKQSMALAEFLGIMLGDGHVAHFQTFVTLGSKELAYVQYVQKLMTTLFGVQAKVTRKKTGYRDVYIGSTVITKWLKAQGLVSNKVASQVEVPDWIMTDMKYMRAFVRGFFDTDGSIYSLRFGVQISITNKSAPLLTALQDMLRRLGYQVSEASAYRIYITKRSEVERFFTDIAPANTKHRRRFKKFLRR